MPRSILYILLMLLLLPTSALAKVNVEISNNLDGSKNTVNVNSNTSTNNQTSNSVGSQTDIVIENNGERKEYHGSDGKIELKSDDGKSSVSVNTTGATNNSTQTSSTVNTKTNIIVNSSTDDSSESATPSPAVAGVSIDVSGNNEQKAGLWEFLKRQLAEIFSLFS